MSEAAAAAATAPATTQAAPVGTPSQATAAAPQADPAKPATPPVAATAEPGKNEATPPAQKTPSEPAKLELKLPEGSTLAPAYVEKVTSFAKELGLSQEQAQKVLERDSQAAIAAEQAQKAMLDQKKSEWFEATKGDPEIGGEAFQQSAELAKRVISRFGSDSFKQALDESGLGNHPELVRFISKVGKAMAEDKLVLPGSQNQNKPPIEQRLYGGTK